MSVIIIKDDNEDVMLVIGVFPEEVNRMARPSKYYTVVQPKLETIAGWAKNGLSHTQIARNLGVAESTFYEYKKQYPELSEALKRGAEDAILEVENALFKSACGFYYDEEVANKDGSITRLTKYAKPNTTSMIFFLKNKAPDQWRDRQEIQADVNQCVIFEGEDDIKD